MSTQTAQPRTKLLEVLDASKETKKSIETKIGRSLANPINAKQEGETFEATLTGEIQLSEYNGRKSAHLLTVEGYRVAVPANFDKTIHKAKSQHNLVCLVVKVNEGTPEERKVKYTAFAA